MNEKEVGRQLVHLSGLIVVYFSLIWEPVWTGFGCLILTLFIFLLSEYTKRRDKIRKKMPVRIKALEKIENSLTDIFISLERDNVKRPYMGAFTFYLSSGIVLVLFPSEIANLSVAVLAVGDSVSSIVGIHFGRNKIFFNSKKSWEGTIGGFLASFVVCSLFSSYALALAASFIGMLIEALPWDMNDNISIPFSISIILSLIV